MPLLAGRLISELRDIAVVVKSLPVVPLELRAMVPELARAGNELD